METKFVEVTNDAFNWGKFAVCRFTPGEWREPSQLPDVPVSGLSLLNSCGWHPRSVLIVDVQTGEGAMFEPVGSAHSDLMTHRIHVCVLFEPFLEYVYRSASADPDWYDQLPRVLHLADAEGGLYGHRRPGEDAAELSKLLWDAREIADMYQDFVKVRTGLRDRHLMDLRDRIDAYRARRGWSPNGFGGEVD